MSMATVLAPVFVLVALAFALLIWMGLLRVRAIRRQELHIRQIAVDTDNWPLRIRLISNAFDNQFQLPVLFYILVALVLITGTATPTFVVLSWLFVAARFLHAAVHVTDNNVPRRFYAYNLGLALLLVMWGWFAVTMATAP